MNRTNHFAVQSIALFGLIVARVGCGGAPATHAPQGATARWWGGRTVTLVKDVAE